jgi:hypothetical protein
MRQVLLPFVGVATVIVVGVVQGFWTDRWHVGEKVDNAVKSLDKVPTVLGDWTGEDLKMGGRDLLGLAGAVYRRYQNKKTGDVISIALVCGRPGPVSIHTPDVCYGASGYKVGKVIEYTVKGAGDTVNAPTFYSADMSKVTASELTQQRLFWTWRSQKRWQVTEDPRVHFAGQPVLFKFYIARDLTAPVPVDQDPIVEFLRQLLPELEKLDDGSV